MDSSPDTDSEPVLAEGHHTLVLVGLGRRTLDVTRSGPDFRARPFIVDYLCGLDNESNLPSPRPHHRT